MALILSYLLFAEGIISLMQAWNSMKENLHVYKENRIFALTAVCSAGWSFCFGFLIVQRDVHNAYICRSVGLLFTFLYLFFGVMLTCWWTKTRNDIKRAVCAVSALGIAIYSLIIGKEDMSFTLTRYGMSYSMTSGVGNRLYILYSIVMAVISFVVILSYLTRIKRKRDKILTHQLLVSQFVMVIGMIFDTIFPLLGAEAFPGSSIAQGITTIILYQALCYSNTLKVSREKMGGYIQELVDIPVFLFDECGTLKIWNNAAENFLSRDIMAQCGEDGYISRLNQLFHLEDPYFDKKIRKLRVEAECRYRNAICRLDINGIYDKYDDLLGYISIVTDLSSERQTMLELAEAKKEAEKANAAKSRFLANMSHEIRTPMHAIIGFSELILKKRIDKEIKGYVEDIKLASHNLLGIINDILDISKLEAGKMEIVEVEYRLSLLMKDLWVVIYPASQRKGIDFRTEIQGKVYENLYGDKVHIREVLLNILNNAVKYTKEGYVVLRISQEIVDDKTANLLFEVQDSGFGIREEDQEQIFAAFSQVDKKQHYGEEGSGLGLTIANDYVQLMGGKLNMESEYGRGTLFRIVIPQEYKNEEIFKNAKNFEENRVEERENHSFMIVNRRVLVVDDNKVNLRVAGGILKTYGVEIDSANDGLEAIEMCRENRYHIIFMDQMMPELDGVETMKRIRNADTFYQGEGHIIALTANALIEEKERLLGEGFDGYLGKPMEIAQLEKLLLEMIPQENIMWQLPEPAADEDEKLPLQLTGVNVEAGLDNCGGQPETYLEILKITDRHGQEQLELLKSLQEQKNYKDYTIKVHALKSTAANIGAFELSKMAERQEMAGKAGDYAVIDSEMPKLLEKYARLLNEIKAVLAVPCEKEDEKEEITNQQIEFVKEELGRLVREFNFQRMEQVLDEVAHFRMKDEEQQFFVNIRKLLDELDIEEMRKSLHVY